MKKNNNLIINLNKVDYMRFYYTNQYGQMLNHAPTGIYSVRLEQVSSNRPAHFHPQYPGETELDRAKRLGLLDFWTPVTCFKITCNETVIYTGQKALVMRDLWWKKIQQMNK